MKENKIKQFGKDHWSLLAYVESRVMNYQGRLDLRHLRIKNVALRNDWRPEYGTRLFGYYNKDGSTNKDLLLTDHDDFDCLDDLERQGLIKSIGTGLNPAYQLTKFGTKIMGELTLHKQSGKNFSDFDRILVESYIGSVEVKE